VLRELVTQSPTDGNVLYLLSEAERRSNDLAEAEAAARRLVALEPTGLRGAYSLALAFEQRRAYREVVETLAPAIDKQPAGSRQVVAPLVHLAFAHQELGDFPAAIAAFERARALNPADASLGMYVGQARWRRSSASGRELRRPPGPPSHGTPLEAQAWRSQGRSTVRSPSSAVRRCAWRYRARLHGAGEPAAMRNARRAACAHDAEAKFAEDPTCRSSAAPSSSSRSGTPRPRRRSAWRSRATRSTRQRSTTSATCSSSRGSGSTRPSR
jgi:tetratricopeptide (TPR) repeat protein